jgi:hypothetical protein
MITEKIADPSFYPLPGLNCIHAWKLMQPGSRMKIDKIVPPSTLSHETLN